MLLKIPTFTHGRERNKRQEAREKLTTENTQLTTLKYPHLPMGADD